jgi:hypothetical protein
MLATTLAGLQSLKGPVADEGSIENACPDREAERKMPFCSRQARSVRGG